jgi:hypothetical protein
MPAAPDTSRSRNGDGNLFLEADPEVPAAPAKSHRPAGSRQPRAAGRGHTLIVIEESPPSVAAIPRRTDAASFTRPTTRLGRLQTWAREQTRRADGNARRLVATLAARRYAALLALALVGALLLALSWMGLALRNADAARHSADRRAAVAAATARRDQAQITALYSLLAQARATQAEQANAAAVPPTRPRSRGAARRTARQRSHGRH